MYSANNWGIKDGGMKKIISNIQKREKIKFWGKFLFCLDNVALAVVPPWGHSSDCHLEGFI